MFIIEGEAKFRDLGANIASQSLSSTNIDANRDIRWFKGAQLVRCAMYETSRRTLISPSQITLVDALWCKS
jgi:hypothetical protein